MALLQDFQDPLGGPRVARVPDWGTDYLVADLNLAGFDLIGLDLNLLGFGPIPPHYVYSGPIGGPSAAPAFRLLTPDEVGAQPHTDSLDQWSSVEPSAFGLNLVTSDPPDIGGNRYMRANGHLDTVNFLSASELADDIDEFLTSVAGINFATSSPGSFTATINGNVNVSDLNIDAPFTCGPDEVTLQTAGATNLLLPAGTKILATVDPDLGWNAWTGTGSKLSRDTNTVILVQVAGAVKALIDALLLKNILHT